MELSFSLVPTALKLLYRCSKVIDGKYQSYTKGPLIFTTEFLLSHFGGPAFPLPQIRSTVLLDPANFVLLISTVFGMQHDVLAN